MMKSVIKKISYIFYYLFFQHLPNSRYWSGFNKIRIWYVSRVMGVLTNEDNPKIQNNVYLASPTKVTIGKGCQINEHSFIQEAEIGNYVMIAPNCTILSKSHRHDRTDIPMALQGEETPQKVIIEDDVWLGRNVLVLPGVTIGKGSICAAGSIITKDVPPFSIVGGVPAKFIKKREQAA